LLVTIRSAADIALWLDEDPAGTLRCMHTDRQPWYLEVADVIVTVDGLTPIEIADRIVP
jgi:shikimate kinase